jgi:bifunctional non-homologous end joining protein LigD
VVVVDAEGRSDFKRLQAALSEPEPDLSYFAFDLLRLDGENLSRRPLIERKRRLAALLGNRGRKGPIFYSDHVEGNGPAFLKAACERGIEGIVSKRSGAPYRTGRSRGWQKCRCGRQQEMVIGGWMPSTAGRPFGSLLLGWHDDAGRLRYAGRVGTGFDEKVFATLGPALQQRARRSSPFTDTPSEVRGRAKWVRPELVAEVAFTEVTRDGRLRHPSFLGLREDKPATEVRLELPEER